MVGHDRFTIYRATELSDESYTGKAKVRSRQGEVGKVGKTIFDRAQEHPFGHESMVVARGFNRYLGWSRFY